MLYSNPEFFVFLAAVLLLYHLTGSQRGVRLWLLVGASLFFYAWTGFLDFVVFLFVVCVSWFAIAMADRANGPRMRRAWVTGGIVVMALHLLFWKYGAWLTSIVQEVYPAFLNGRRFQVLLPVGISFFTLQGIAYLVDFGRGEAEYIGFRRFLLFKSFFPQLIAGPIVRVHQLAPQLQVLKRPSLTDLQSGLNLMALGLFKKIAVADRMRPIVDPVFQQYREYSTSSLLLGLLGYTVEIWGDFSGYTDMGRGAAAMLGIQLPENFFAPYLSKSPSEFWRRWHVTLSQWIRDYVYIPLGGAHGSMLRVTLVVVVTMSLSGLWHGAALTFLFWGLYHGALLSLERLSVRLGIPVFGARLSMLPMFALTTLGWLVFRSASLRDSVGMLSMMTGMSAAGAQRVSLLPVLWGVGSCLALHVLNHRSLDEVAAPSLWQRVQGRAELAWGVRAPFVSAGLAGATMALFVVATLLLRASDRSAQFIYFQF